MLIQFLLVIHLSVHGFKSSHTKYFMCIQRIESLKSLISSENVIRFSDICNIVENSQKPSSALVRNIHDSPSNFNTLDSMGLLIIKFDQVTNLKSNIILKAKA